MVTQCMKEILTQSDGADGKMQLRKICEHFGYLIQRFFGLQLLRCGFAGNYLIKPIKKATQ